MRSNKYCIARRLKQARLAARVSQKELGILAGIDESSASVRISQYETGTHIPNLLTLHHIGEALGYPVAFFVCEDDIFAETIYFIGQLSETEKYKIFNTAQKLALPHDAKAKPATEDVV